MKISYLCTKSTGVVCHPNTVMDFVGFLRDACMVFSLNNYVSSNRGSPHCPNNGARHKKQKKK